MEVNDKLAIGERVRRLREDRRMSREEFAELLNISTVFLRSIECGQRGMSVETLINICRVLNVSSDAILFGNNGADTVRSALCTLINELDERCLPFAMTVISELTKLSVCFKGTA